jgi:hypothetical protein
MKKILSLLFCFSVGIAARAQNGPFLFQALSQQPYAELSPPLQSLNNGAIWDRNASFSTPLGFTFTFRNQPITTVNVLARGVQFVGAGNLYLFVYNTPFGGSLIQDRGIVSNTGSLSPISYALSGTVGNRIGKIEWKNAGVAQSSPVAPDPAHFVSCQLWLFEQGGRMEIHFGNSVTTAASFHNNFIFIKTHSDNNLAVTPTGNSNNPNSIVENCSTPCYGSVTGTPAVGMVYVFTPNNSFPSASRPPAALTFSSYPNPARRQLTLNLQGASANEVDGRLLDAQGRTVYTFHLSAQQAKAPVDVMLPALARGLYALHLHCSDGRQRTQRLMIE